jgi:hypothetical protein
MSDYGEDFLLRTHHICICTTSLLLSSCYCVMDLGICRPHPMYFYLQNDWKENDFHREPVSIAFVGIFIASILTLQGLIEIKKRKANQDDCHAEDIAIAAKQNLENAKIKLNVQKVLEICDFESSPPQQFEIGIKSHSCVPTVVSVEESIKKRNVDFVSSQYALKVARAVSIFAIFPTSIFCFFFSLENAGNWRPHGAAASSMILFGIFAPLVFYVKNAKMRQFANNYLTAELKRWKIQRKPRRIVPIV